MARMADATISPAELTRLSASARGGLNGNIACRMKAATKSTGRASASDTVGPPKAHAAVGATNRNQAMMPTGESQRQSSGSAGITTKETSTASTRARHTVSHVKRCTSARKSCLPKNTKPKKENIFLFVCSHVSVVMIISQLVSIFFAKNGKEL